MSVQVVTVWKKPNPGVGCTDEHIYFQLLNYQRRTVQQYGHQHLVVTDDEKVPAEHTKFHCALPDQVMPAMIAGVLERLAQPVDSHLLFVDVDVLIGRNLEEAFDGSFDLGLTRRISHKAPINNGAMYVHQDGIEHAQRFFRCAYALCGNHWGADQEAISQAAAPVPEVEVVEDRDGMRLAFLSMKMYNCVPKNKGLRHTDNPYVIHFKGGTKAWAKEYAMNFIFE